MAEAGVETKKTVKKWWKSSTVWFNVLTTAAELGSGALGIPLPVSAKTVTIFNAVVNTALRLFKTKHPLNTTVKAEHD